MTTLSCVISNFKKPQIIKQQWLRWLAKEWLESTLVVLLVVYGCFFVCEVMFGVSGILSVVVIGLGMGRIGIITYILMFVPENVMSLL
jgi:NhaP-type Na+/H+ or K+/H+ antiporter